MNEGEICCYVSSS